MAQYNVFPQFNKPSERKEPSKRLAMANSGKKNKQVAQVRGLWGDEYKDFPTREEAATWVEQKKRESSVGTSYVAPEKQKLTPLFYDPELYKPIIGAGGKPIVHEDPLYKVSEIATKIIYPLAIGIPTGGIQRLKLLWNYGTQDIKKIWLEHLKQVEKWSVYKHTKELTTWNKKEVGE